MLGFLPTRAYRPGTPGATTFLSPLSGTFNYGWDSFQIDIGCSECAQNLSKIISEVIITAETPTTITATFHDALGNLLVKGFDDYQFTLTPLDPELLRFTRTGAFAGMLMRIAPGQTAVEVALYNVLTQTFDFGPFPVPVMAE